MYIHVRIKKLDRNIVIYIITVLLASCTRNKNHQVTSTALFIIIFHHYYLSLFIIRQL